MSDTQGHGWVIPRKDGVKARCGGPAICSVCKRERELVDGVGKDGQKLSGLKIDKIVFSEPQDSIGSAIDALNAGIAMVNAASERMKAFGLSPQIYVNGHDFGDKVSVRLDGDLVR